MTGSNKQTAHRVVIVGGGAGGLELAVRLGNAMGKSGKMAITLEDVDIAGFLRALTERFELLGFSVVFDRPGAW